MLPLVTCHYIKMVLFIKVLHILSIGIKRQVIRIFLAPAVISKIVIAYGIGTNCCCLLTCREVCTTISMDMQILKTMNSIINLNISYKRLRGGTIILQFKQCYRVRSCIAIVCLHPGFIKIGSSRIPLCVAAEIFGINLIVRSCYWLRGVHIASSTYGSSISITVLGNHSLSVDIKLQVIL